MSLSPQERKKLIETLASIMPQLLNKIIFSFKVPRGTIPDGNATSSDKAYALLQWAEGPEGCGLQSVRDFLYSETEPSEPPVSRPIKPFLMVSEEEEEEKVYWIWDINKEDWCKLPCRAPGISGEVISKGTQESQYAQAWKQVHSLTELLYPKYITLHHYMLLAQTAHKLNGKQEVDYYKYMAATIFEELRSLSQSVKKSLEELSIVRAEPVSVLLHIPTCSPAISQSLALDPTTDIFTNSMDLTQKICDWLLNALHIADRILELYFEENLKAS